MSFLDALPGATIALLDAAFSARSPLSLSFFFFGLGASVESPAPPASLLESPSETTSDDFGFLVGDAESEAVRERK